MGWTGRHTSLVDANKLHWLETSDRRRSDRVPANAFRTGSIRFRNIIRSESKVTADPIVNHSNCDTFAMTAKGLRRTTATDAQSPAAERRTRPIADVYNPSGRHSEKVHRVEPVEDMHRQPRQSDLGPN
jgi:hypothetical protein